MKRNLTAAAFTGLGVAAVATAVALTANGASDTGDGSATAATTSSSAPPTASTQQTARAGTLPDCPPPDEDPGATVQITTHDGPMPGFARSCYYAPANTPLTLRFTNLVVSSEDNQPLTLRLVLADEPYPNPIPGVPMGLDLSTARFVGDDVTARNSGSFEIGSLAPGTYALQATPLHEDFLGSLVVR